jgi:hypothetical protein
MEKVFEVWVRATPERLWEAITGETVEQEPPRRLGETMKAHWSPQVESYPATAITWEINPRGEMCQVRVTHSGLSEEMSDEIWGGWPMILSSLKSLIETGESLNLRVPPQAVEQWRAQEGAA